MKVKGSQAIIKVLLEQGVDTVFGYPGGQVIPLYDALYDAPLKNERGYKACAVSGRWRAEQRCWRRAGGVGGQGRPTHREHIDGCGRGASQQ